jgi:hypothetical protein
MMLEQKLSKVIVGFGLTLLQDWSKTMILDNISARMTYNATFNQDPVSAKVNCMM